MVKILKIVPSGIADSLSLEIGDQVVSVNGVLVRDFLDVLIAEALEDVSLIVERNDGELWQLDIEKEAEEPFGVILEHPEPQHCGNKCIFCFVHQLPKGMRQTLYVKDEDYRFSYLYGSYITLSNLKEADIERIIEQKLSPLYISVHAIDEELRSRMLGRQLPPVLPILKRLVDNGITLHTQVVVCPEVNDGVALHESVQQLSSLYPGIKTLALVPVGLTSHREQLELLRISTADEARQIVADLSGWQQKFKEKCGSRFVFAADEFYLKADITLPEIAEYEDLSQLANGVGLIAEFRHEMNELLAEADELHLPVEFSVVTGQAFFPDMERFLALLADRTACQPHPYGIENDFFGSIVTVAGLVTGQDIEAQLENKKLGSALLIPDVMMRDGDDHFLDNMRPTELAEKLNCRVIVVPSTPWGILEAIEDIVMS